MSTESQPQIAREAAQKIMLHRPGSLPNQFTLEEIILSAIERATAEPEYNLTTSEFERRMAQPQPATSGKLRDQQVEDSEFNRRGGWREWTPETVAELFNYNRIADAHNAAIEQYKEKAWKYDQLNK